MVGEEALGPVDTASSTFVGWGWTESYTVLLLPPSLLSAVMGFPLCDGDVCPGANDLYDGLASLVPLVHRMALWISSLARPYSLSVGSVVC